MEAFTPPRECFDRSVPSPFTRTSSASCPKRQEGTRGKPTPRRNREPRRRSFATRLENTPPVRKRRVSSRSCRAAACDYLGAIRAIFQ